MNIGMMENCNMKMLYILNVANRVNNFSYTSMMAAQECGFEFHIAGNWSYKNGEELMADEKKYGIRIHQIDFVRKPYSFKNYKAYKQLLELCKKEKYDAIHCNTPIGGLLGRIVGSKCKVKTIIYQAHGFHFYKGAPLVNWLVYYPIEKWLAHKTDIIITINNEDFILAEKRMRLKKGGKIEFIPGVGIDTQCYKKNYYIRNKKRSELGVQDTDILIISIGDLIPRKNYEISIEAISMIKSHNVHYFICGKGVSEKRLIYKINNLGLERKIHLLGYRDDVKDLLNASDIFVISSKQEGIPRSTMEAMASGLPCVASKIRGNTDLLADICDDYLCNPNDANDFACKLNILIENTKKRIDVGNMLLEEIRKLDTKVIVDKTIAIYKTLMD